ncbi:C40 family peptidase [Paenibacillus xerothermodurans]|uniref:C40 family peptidase n=1 Tax=Paenibacillus xerothermodurans TaxID=1977292 RepID=UPI001404060E|nr:C40 family peptidase [Paenibacillus xerothermodurans]
MADQYAYPNIPVYTDNEGLLWVPLEQAVRSMDMDLHAVNNKYTIGTTGPAYSVEVNNSGALIGDRPIELPQAPRILVNKPYMTTEALSALLGTSITWNEQNSRIVLSPITESVPPQQTPPVAAQGDDGGANQVRGLAMDPATKQQVVDYAKQFMGTRYEFAAEPYEESHAFDCSSFVQHVYERFGVDLPRSSRSQGEVGQNVSLNELQPGDLMFFYTPGRFESNRTVGHVGMYAGNGQIVQTFGEPGVTVSEFDEQWQERFLFAKRI